MSLLLYDYNYNLKFHFPLSRDIYSGHSPPPLGGGRIFVKFENREEFGGGLEKGKEKGGKEENKEKSDKTHIKMPL